MTDWQDDAIIIRLGCFNEANVWARALFRRYGLLTVFAFGALKSKRRFCGCLDIFNSLSCHVKASGKGEYLVLQEASLLKGPVSLRSNWRRMGLAANCLLFLQSLEIDVESSMECFMALENLRNFLETGAPATTLLPLIFRLRIGAALGISPDFAKCGQCGQEIEGQGLFLPAEGSVFCASCARNFGPSQRRSGLWLHDKALKYLHEVKSALPQDWRDAALSPNDRRLCAQAIDSFISWHFDTGKLKSALSS